MDGLLPIVVASMICGYVIGNILGERRAKRYYTQPVTLKVTPEVASQLTRSMVGTWLDLNGLVAMPKGKEFHWPKEVKR